MSIEKRAAPYQDPSDLNVASRPGGLSYGTLAGDRPPRYGTETFS